MTKSKSYQRYPAEFKRMALLKASEEGDYKLINVLPKNEDE